MKLPFRRSKQNYLADHLRSQMGTGHSLDTVIRSLRDSGWSDSEIQNAMAQLNDETKKFNRESEIKPAKPPHKKISIILAFITLSVIGIYILVRIIINGFFPPEEPLPDLPDNVDSASDLFD